MERILIAAGVALFGLGMGLGASAANSGTDINGIFQLAVAITVGGVGGIVYSAFCSGDNKIPPYQEDAH